MTIWCILPKYIPVKTGPYYYKESVSGVFKIQIQREQPRGYLILFVLSIACKFLNTDKANINYSLDSPRIVSKNEKPIEEILGPDL